jgi:hypothetical protein
VEVRAAAVELEGAGGDAVEDVAVVGDEQQPAAVLGQAGLEPGDGVDVEVVGGLVEHEQVGLGQEGTGQGHPLGLAARQRGDVDARHRPHAQAVEDGLGLPPLADSGERGAGRQRGVLAQHRDAHAAPPAHRPGVGLALAGQDAQQRGLALPVQPDDAHAVAVGDRDGAVGEERPLPRSGRHPLRVDEDQRPVTFDARLINGRRGPAGRAAGPGCG